MIGKTREPKTSAPEDTAGADAASDQGPDVQEILQRLRVLEGPDGGVTGVLMIKDPGALQAAESYEGLRRQVIAAMTSRRAHLAQLTQMAVAVQRATSVDDLRAMVKEWMTQAGIVEVRGQRDGHQVTELFEIIGGTPASGAVQIDIVEPAYVDDATNTIIRLGRAQVAGPAPEKQAAGPDTAPAPATEIEEPAAAAPTNEETA